MANVYEIVTEKVLEALAAGVVPWRRPWASNGQDMPSSLRTGKSYRGINVWLLLASAMAHGYRSNKWLTYDYALELGGNVRRGEHGTLIVFWKFDDRQQDEDGGDEGEDGARGSRCIMRYYRVFNTEQCDGLPASTEPVITAPASQFTPIAQAAAVIEGMPKRPEIQHGGDRAYYVPVMDRVSLPNPEQFTDPQHYYNVAFHELGHSTGHTSRLARKEVGMAGVAFASHAYSREELVAEFCAAFLCAHVGIESQTLADSAAYIDHWSRALRADSKLVVGAAQAAQKAADFILNQTPAS